MVGGAVAAALAGYIHDAAGDYGYAMYLGGVLALFAAALAFNIGARAPRSGGMAAPAAGY
jgi:sugar phosphate permease